MTDILKAVFPQWQGGVNPNYILGAQLMDLIVPNSSAMERVEIPVVVKDSSDLLERKNGIDASESLHQQIAYFQQVLNEKQPQRVLTIGGDCAVSLAPFDYLNGRYGDKLGLIWLDAHPDVSGEGQSHHLHEMVVSTLIKQGSKAFNDRIANPLSSQQVLMAGLIKEDLRPIDQNVYNFKLELLTAQELQQNPEKLGQWLESYGFDKVAVHFDLDVLTPEDFRSIYPAEPGLNAADFPAAVGRLTLQDLANVFKVIDESADLVGLTIAEHMAWDALRLRQLLGGLTFFNAS